MTSVPFLFTEARKPIDTMVKLVDEGGTEQGHPPTPPPVGVVVRHAQQQQQMSMSETVNAAEGGSRAPFVRQWLEMPFTVADPKTGNKLAEVCGWAMNSAGRGPLNLVGSYVGNAILRLAIKEAGGINNVVRGLLKPSSLLTATSSIAGIIVALVMPVFGAIVDHTQHRRMVGTVSGIVSVALIGIQISISLERNNWFFILIIDAIQSIAFLVHNAAVFAYLPDLSMNEDVMSHYSSRLNIRQYAVSFLYVSLSVITTKARGNGRSKAITATVQTARDAAGMSFGIGCLLVGYSWSFLFSDRPALSKVPEGSNLLSTGFVQVRKTAKKIWKDYRALKWFLISLLWSPEAGAGVVLSIAVTYLTVVVKFTGQDLAKGTLVLMAATIIGSIFAKVACRLLNPLNSYRLGLTFLGVTFGISPFTLTGPERRRAVFGFGAAWGFALGWSYPSQRVLFCTLIPKGQETEMMGLFTFMGQIIGWLPPLIVTIMNEKGMNLKWSLAVPCLFCMFAVLNTLPMGNYQEATELVARDSTDKLKAVLELAVSRNKTGEKAKMIPTAAIQSEGYFACDCRRS
jgi:MFS transporter, UMF1 family